MFNELFTISGTKVNSLKDIPEDCKLLIVKASEEKNSPQF